jgi:hypothetical protein
MRILLKLWTWLSLKPAFRAFFTTCFTGPGLSTVFAARACFYAALLDFFGLFFGGEQLASLLSSSPSLFINPNIFLFKLGSSISMSLGLLGEMS